MRILLAPNAFKGTFSAIAAARIIQRGLKSSGLDDIVVHPVTDGGDGFVSTLDHFLSARSISSAICASISNEISATLLFAGSDCYIEAAQGCGLAVFGQSHPFKRTTRGVGEMISFALSEGARRIFIGLGGSATVDIGIGMATVLGVKFLDASGREICIHSIEDFDQIADCSPEQARSLTQDIEIIGICDVAVPLLGSNGGLSIFGPQKGVTPGMMEVLLNKAGHAADVFDKACGIEASKMNGAGSAGGTGAALAWFTGATLRAGFEWFAGLTSLHEKISLCDVVVTGEGQFDATSFKGKASAELISLALMLRKPVFVISGTGDAGNIAIPGVTTAPILYGPKESYAIYEQAVVALERTALALGCQIRGIDNGITGI